MTVRLLIVLFTASASNCFGQINMADSSAQIIGYWSIGDTQSYNISLENYRIKGSDTTSRVMIKYEVDITIKDSTENSYSIEWFYRDFDINTDSELVQKISSAAENVSVLIKTDEFGTVQEVLNWEEVRDYMDKMMDTLKTALKHIKGAERIIEESLAMYKNKEAIEANAIKDVIQFYDFHGGKYILNEEVTGEMQYANNYGGEPFDVDLIIRMDELNQEDDNLVMRMHQSVNSEQLTKATYEYLKKTPAFRDKMPVIEEFPTLTSDTWTASRIHGDTGWIIYSILTKEVNSEDITNIEERIIEIK